MEPAYLMPCVAGASKTMSSKSGNVIVIATTPLVATRSRKHPAEYATARRAFEQAAARDPTQPRIWLNLVNTCMRLDDLAGARHAAEQMVRLMPGNAPAAQMLAEIERREAERRYPDPR